MKINFDGPIQVNGKELIYDIKNEDIILDSNIDTPKLNIKNENGIISLNLTFPEVNTDFNIYKQDENENSPLLHLSYNSDHWIHTTELINSITDAANSEQNAISNTLFSSWYNHIDNLLSEIIQNLPEDTTEEISKNYTTDLLITQPVFKKDNANFIINPIIKMDSNTDSYTITYTFSGSEDSKIIAKCYPEEILNIESDNKTYVTLSRKKENYEGSILIRLYANDNLLIHDEIIANIEPINT